VRVPLDELRQVVEQLGAANPALPPPGGIRGAGRLHGAFRVLGASRWETANHFIAMRRVTAIEAGRGAIEPAAADQVATGEGGDRAHDDPHRSDNGTKVEPGCVRLEMSFRVAKPSAMPSSLPYFTGARQER